MRNHPTPDYLTKVEEETENSGFSPLFPPLPPSSPLSFPPPSGGDLLQPGAASTLELLLPRYEANYLSCLTCTNTLAASIHLLHLWEQVWEALGDLGGGGDVVQVPANECSVWPSHKNFQVGAKPLGNMCMCNVYSLSHQCILAVGVQQ